MVSLRRGKATGLGSKDFLMEIRAAGWGIGASRTSEFPPLGWLDASATPATKVSTKTRFYPRMLRRIVEYLVCNIAVATSCCSRLCSTRSNRNSRDHRDGTMGERGYTDNLRNSRHREKDAIEESRRTREELVNIDGSCVTG